MLINIITYIICEQCGHTFVQKDEAYEKALMVIIDDPIVIWYCPTCLFRNIW